LMILCGLLCLYSDFPRYDLHPIDVRHLNESAIVFATLRIICPTMGILMLVFIPSNHHLQELMDQRLTQRGYEVTIEDKNLFIESQVQSNLHAAGGVISFVVSTFLETASLGDALFCHFFSGARKCRPT